MHLSHCAVPSGIHIPTLCAIINSAGSHAHDLQRRSGPLLGKEIMSIFDGAPFLGRPGCSTPYN